MFNPVLASLGQPGGTNPKAVLQSVAAALGLPGDATPEQIRETFETVMSAAGAPAPAPSENAAEAAALASLSDNERRILRESARDGQRCSAVDFIKLRDQRDSGITNGRRP